MQQFFESKGEILSQTKIEFDWICCSRPALQEMKIFPQIEKKMQTRNLNLYNKRKNIGEWLREDKIKTYIFLILNWFNKWLLKLIVSTRLCILMDIHVLCILVYKWNK